MRVLHWRIRLALARGFVGQAECAIRQLRLICCRRRYNMSHPEHSFDHCKAVSETKGPGAPAEFVGAGVARLNGPAA
jgi:hypothetical protein